MSRSATPLTTRTTGQGLKPSVGDAPADVRHRWQQVWSGMVAAIFFSRFFLPAESAAQGDTLWIAGLWMLCGLVWMAGVWRGAFPRFRFDGLDLAVAMWIGGQVVSALIVVLTTGDKRAAANLGWEWIAIGMVWLVFRHGIVEWSQRSSLLRAMIVTGTVLAGYGLYQHHVSHPQLVAEYSPLFDRLRSASGSEAAAIAQKLAQAGIPTEGPALVLFEKRLRDSREPMGLFALANTFGGCLAVCLLLTLGEVLAARQRGAGWRSLVPLMVAAGVMGWCLLLTKSRTAWIGSACGLLVLAALRVAPAARVMAGARLRSAVDSRRFLLPVGLSFAAILAVTTLVVSLGGLDRQVLSEAPKSLAYRIQYWQATSRLVADHLWLGVGPGNFRQHYLKYKLPEASEEIVDPHNLFFEVAATGGILSLIGLTLFLGLAFVFGWRWLCAESKDHAPNGTHFSNPTRERGRATAVIPRNSLADASGYLAKVSAIDHAPPTTTPDLRASKPDSPVYWAAGGGAVLAFAGSLAFWGEWEDRLLVLAVIWFLVAWVMNRRPATTDPGDRLRKSPAALAACVTLTVHLLGAGGIGMPGVSQILVALVAMSLPPPRDPIPTVPSARPIGSVVIGVVCAAVLVGLTATSLLPVWKCRGLLRQGLAAGWSTGPNGRAMAMTCFRQAALADPWSAEPWRHQFEWSAATGFQSNESFQMAVEQLLAARSRDPVNFWAPRNLGTVWHQKWQRTREREDARQAVEWLRRALDLYPTNAVIRAELAFALESAGERAKAVITALSAITQDDISHQQGHVDRYLNDSIRQRLQTLVTAKPR